MPADDRLPPGPDPSVGEPVEVVAHEEELVAGARSTAQGASRVRVRKVIVTERRTLTVDVRREELRIEHEPLAADDPAAAGPVGEDGDLELVLHAEEPVVDTRVVPVERVRVRRHVVTEERPVGGEVRRERVEVEPPQGGARDTADAPTGPT